MTSQTQFIFINNKEKKKIFFHSLLEQFLEKEKKIEKMTEQALVLSFDLPCSWCYSSIHWILIFGITLKSK